jgi:hypothetical protein
MRFTITIKVDYDKLTVPEDMEQQLRDNVDRCVQNAELLNDSNLEAVVDEWEVEVAMRFTITIKVDYDKLTVPEDMEQQLRDNVDRCVQNAELLNDSELEAVVDEWEVEVVSEGHR